MELIEEEEAEERSESRRQSGRMEEVDPGDVNFKSPPEKREVTDKIWLIIFLVTLAIWIGIGIYGCYYYYYEIPLIDSDKAKHQINAVNRIQKKESLKLEVTYRVYATQDTSETSVPTVGLYELSAGSNTSKVTEKPTEDLDINDKVFLMILIYEIVCAIFDVKYFVAAAACGAVFVSIVYVKLLQCASRVVTWACMTLLAVLLFAGLLYSIVSIAYQYKYFGNFHCVFGWGLLVTTIIMLIIYTLFLVRNKQKMKQGIIMLAESSRITKGKLLPILTAGLTLTFIMTGMFYALLVFMSIGTSPNGFYIGKNNQSCECKGIYQNLTKGDFCSPALIKEYCENCENGCINYFDYHFLSFTSPLVAFDVVAYLWFQCFVTHLSYSILGGSYAFSYYRNSRESQKNNTLYPIKLLFRYHLGTIALGSLVTVTTTITSAASMLYHQFHCVLRLLERPTSRGKPKRPWQRIFQTHDVLLLCRHSYITSLIFGTSFKDSAVRILKVWQCHPLKICKVARNILVYSFISIACAITIICSFEINISIGKKIVALSLIFVVTCLLACMIVCICSVGAEVLVLVYMENQSEIASSCPTSFDIPPKLMRSLLKICKKNDRVDTHSTTLSVKSDQPGLIGDH